MGADLILNFVWAKKDSPPDWDGAKKYIESLTDEQLLNHPEYEYEVMVHEEEVGDGKALAHLKERLLNAHDIVKAAWDGDCDRSTFLLDIGIYKVLVTGGTSWGDSPSDMFDYIQDWGNIEGLDKFGFYNA